MHIKSIFIKEVFGSDKKELFEKIAEYPERFTGFFRPTKPYSKVLQFLFQSHEIRFGNALEQVIEYMFKSAGFSVETNKKYKVQDDTLSIDLIIKDNEKSCYIVEMKVRDDHDSSKKRGQMENLRRKIKVFVEQESIIPSCILYFVDPTLRKNRNYYAQELKKFKETYNTETFLFYGGEIFEHFGHKGLWELFLKCLKEWKEELSDIPSINYDDNLENSVEVLKGISLHYWNRIVKNDELWEKGGVINSIFRTGETFYKLIEIFRASDKTKTIANELEKKVKNLYK